MLKRLLVALLLFTASCGESAKESTAPSSNEIHAKMLGKWKIISVMTDEFKKLKKPDFDSLMVHLIGNSFLDFKDSTFFGKMGPDVVEGKWSVNPDGKHIIMGEEEEVLEIGKLDKDTLILINVSTKSPVTIKSVRIKTE